MVLHKKLTKQKRCNYKRVDPYAGHHGAPFFIAIIIFHVLLFCNERVTGAQYFLDDGQHYVSDFHGHHRHPGQNSILSPHGNPPYTEVEPNYSLEEDFQVDPYSHLTQVIPPGQVSQIQSMPQMEQQQQHQQQQVKQQPIQMQDDMVQQQPMEMKNPITPQQQQLIEMQNHMIQKKPIEMQNPMTQQQPIELQDPMVKQEPMAVKNPMTQQQPIELQDPVTQQQPIEMQNEMMKQQPPFEIQNPIIQPQIDQIQQKPMEVQNPNPLVQPQINDQINQQPILIQNPMGLSQVQPQPMTMQNPMIPPQLYQILQQQLIQQQQMFQQQQIRQQPMMFQQQIQQQPMIQQQQIQGHPQVQTGQMQKPETQTPSKKARKPKSAVFRAISGVQNWFTTNASPVLSLGNIFVTEKSIMPYTIALLAAYAVNLMLQNTNPDEEKDVAATLDHDFDPLDYYYDSYYGYGYYPHDYRRRQRKMKVTTTPAPPPAPEAPKPPVNQFLFSTPLGSLNLQSNANDKHKLLDKLFGIKKRLGLLKQEKRKKDQTKYKRNSSKSSRKYQSKFVPENSGDSDESSESVEN